ncbi:Uncharacterised protein [Campylobacter hyointestinalis subsp. hyointestinalis]|nr:Uncharacterised protein [Campylobacter hyointestinalis subsp. hyointestinalis]CUU70343.1 Uncharacterised protein [Campylobacter hyointestinalis subsp. hyointestinalis]CUU74188.1 Uncharacterised protein [Campylobacter hyointestinalis subsp. hyointestinalis]
MRFLRIFQAFIVVVLLALFLPKFIDSILFDDKTGYL